MSESNKHIPAETITNIIESRHGVYSVYANNVEAQWTTNDLRIKFGELIKITEATGEAPRVFTVEERVAVTLAWSKAKVLSEILSDIIRRFEAKNGEIRTPDIP